MQTYSPWLNRFETDADSEFTLDFPMGGAFAAAGSVTVPSGSTASITPSALEPNTQYEWQVTVTNGSGKSRTGPVWRFTTGSGGPVNQPPTADSQSVTTPEDSARAITLGASDPEGAALTYTIVSGPAHGTLERQRAGADLSASGELQRRRQLHVPGQRRRANSTVATVSIAVQPVNDPPSATGEAYTVQSGTTLTVAAPGVLGNDTDIDSGDARGCNSYQVRPMAR